MSPSWALPAPPKRRNYALVALVVLLLVAVVAGSSAALYLVANGQHGSGVLLAPTPRPTPEYTQVENDPLTSGADGWREDSHCFLSGGSYHVKDGWYCYAPLDPFANGDISVQVKQISGQPNWFYGMVFRVADNGDLYALFIDSVGEWEFSKFVNRAWSELVPYVTTNALHRGLQVSNTLEVRMNATHFDFYLNGIKVGQANDATLTSGFAGVIGSEKIEVAFNNFDAKVIN